MRMSLYAAENVYHMAHFVIFHEGIEDLTCMAHFAIFCEKISPRTLAFNRFATKLDFRGLHLEFTVFLILLI